MALHLSRSTLLLMALATDSAGATDFGLSASLGSTGPGLHLSLPLQPNLQARLGVSTLRHTYGTSSRDLRYDFRLKYTSVDALLDYFPNDSAFRVTGGVTYRQQPIEASGLTDAAGNFTLAGRTYAATSSGTPEGKIDFRNVAPYLGIGWGNPVRKQGGWGFSADAGVLFQGSPSTTLTSNACTASAAACSQLAADLAAENAHLRDKADDLKLYPVVRIGASYRF